MAFQPVPNTAQVEVIFESNGTIVENVYHVEKSGPWTPIELQNLTSTFQDWWKSELAAMVSAQVTLLRVDARDLTQEAAPFFSLPCTVNCSGTSLGANLPNHVTVAIKWTGGLTGRSQRGRTYHIGLTEPQVSGDSIQEVDRQALLDAYANLISFLVTADPEWELVVVSRISEGVPRLEGQTTPITSVGVDPTVDSQRRRLKGRGQ